MAQQQSNINGTELLIAAAVLGVGGYALYEIVQNLKLDLGGLSSANSNAGVTGNPWSQTWWQSSAVPAGAYILTDAAATNLCNIIGTYSGVFQDDDAAVLGAIKSLKTQSQCSYLSYYFQQLYGHDLYSYLKSGGGVLPWDGLSNDHLTEINTYVNNLPLFTP